MATYHAPASPWNAVAGGCVLSAASAGLAGAACSALRAQGRAAQRWMQLGGAVQQCKIPRDCATTTLKRGCGRQRWARRHRALTAALFLTFLPDAILCFYSLRGLLYSSREYHVPSPVTQIWVGSKCLLRLELFTLPATPPRSWGPVLTSSENVGFKVSPMRPPQAAPRPCRCS